LLCGLARTTLFQNFPNMFSINIRLCLLGTATWQLAVNALPEPLQLQTGTSTASVTPSKTIDIGTAPIATFAEAGCNIQGSLAPLPSVLVENFTTTDPVECQWMCQTETPCRFYSWDTSPSNPKRCTLYDQNSFNFTVIPANTTVYFSQRKDCYAVTNMNSTSSRKFSQGGQNMWINTAIHDCGVEGSPTSSTQLQGENYQFDTILECQQECNGVNGCHSYAWDANAPDDANNCHLHSGWISEYLTPNKSGTYWSDSTAKMNNDCFRNKSFAAASKIARDKPTSTIIGLPEITATHNENCNVQGSVPPSSTVQYTVETDYTVLQCMYTCLVTTFCQTYSWDASASTNNCHLYASSISGLSLTPGNSSTYFSAKYSSCNAVSKKNSTSNIPFTPEKGIYVNTGVSDCGIEGTADEKYGGSNVGVHTYDSVLTCQRECDLEQNCTSYSWEPSTGRCVFEWYWVAGHVTPGKTGVWFSDAGGKTGNTCFSDKAFGN